MAKLEDHISMSHTHSIHSQMIILQIKGNDDQFRWNEMVSRSINHFKHKLQFF